MPPHLKKRLDRKGVYYLVDGRLLKSLGTTVKRFAEHRLDQYVKGKFVTIFPQQAATAEPIWPMNPAAPANIGGKQS